MHPLGIFLAIFVAGYITARWDLITQLIELAIFAYEHGVVNRAAKGFAILSVFFFIFVLPLERLAAYETSLHPRSAVDGISAKEQLKRRGSLD